MNIDRKIIELNSNHQIASEWPLSSTQSRIWLLSAIGNESIYGRQMLGLALVDIDADFAAKRLAQLCARHPLITRRFELKPGGVVYQHVPDAGGFDIVEHQVADGADTDDVVRAVARSERDRHIDLEQENPARFYLFKRGDKAVGVLFSLHAIVADSATLGQLAEDFTRSLRTGSGETVKAPSTSWSFKQDAARTPTADKVDFWFDRLGGQENIAVLTPVMPEGSEPGSWTEIETRVRLDSSVSKGRLETDLLTGLAVVLRRYSGSGTQRIGLATRATAAGVAMRTEDILIVVGEINGSMTFQETGQHFEREIAASRQNFIPFETLADSLLRRDESFETTALARTILDLRSAYSLDDTSTRVIIEPPARRDAELVMTVRPGSDGSFKITFGFDPQKQSLRHVARFADDLKIALDHLGSAPTPLIRNTPFVSQAELERLSAPYPDQPQQDDGVPVHEVIAAQASRRPDAFAVAQGDRSVTHGELEASANRLAHHLIALGIGPEKRVAVALDKSIDAIVAILAVMKAGGAFTPVEPDHPEARNRHILSAPGLSLVITRKRFRESLPQDVVVPKLDIDGIDLSLESDKPPTSTIRPDQLAYVIYTSGSTGVPKGVAVEQGPLAHHCKATLRIYEMSEESCEYPVLPFTSDGGHERWMVPLMAGGGVILTSDKLATPDEAFALMRKHGVNNASLPTSYVRGLAEYASEHPDIPGLRLYSFGGEALPRAVFDMINDNLQAPLLINGYGPTETIMTPMIWKIPLGTRFEGTVAPIGRGVGDRRIYILDEDLAPVPVGVVGEIHIGGSGLARGYQGRPDLTEERFIPDPFASGAGRMYKSGDLGRWREDGIVEFAGRVDHQIKLRGYRIEPGEIEAVLSADPRIAETVVLLHHDGARSSPVAYVEPREGESVSVTELRRAAMVALPDYMVPQTIMLIDKLPMGPNSKLDRAALPAPYLERETIAPENDRERDILTVWRDVLDIPDVGVTENFFDIGGQSLAAVRIVSRLKTHYPDWPLTIADMFNHPTVRDLAAALDGARDDTGVNVIYLRRSGDRPVLYCFPGLLVSTREYMRLVDYLGPDQPATGFICYSLSETKTLSTRVEDITARYAEEVRSLAKGRPCAFLGWSWGGLLAYEAAQQLGSDIDLRMIGMVDVCDMDEEFTVGILPRFEESVRDRTHRRVQEWLTVAPMRDDWQRLFAAMDSEIYEQFLSHVVKHDVVLPVDGPDIGSEEHTFWVLVDNAMIFRNYKLSQSDFRIHAFAAEDSLTRSLNVIDWRRYSSRATAPEIVNGTNHLTIIGKSPFHQRFARRLDEALVSKLHRTNELV